MMQGDVKNGSADLAPARRALQRLRERASTVRIATDTGIHQSQVSRLLRGQFQRISPNVRVLVAYAAQAKARRRQAAVPAGKAAVIKAALRTWDATPEGARALVRLLRSVRELRRGKPPA